MLTPCGPSFRRCLDKTIVTSPSLWRVARRRTPPSSRRRPSGVGLARRWAHLLGPWDTRARSGVPCVNVRGRGLAKTSAERCAGRRRRGALAAQPAAATTTTCGTPAGGTQSCSLCRKRLCCCPRHSGSRRARAPGTRDRSPLARRRTTSPPNISGACALWRVVRPTGGVRPRVAGNGRSPRRDKTPSAGGGRTRRVAVARSHPTASASPGPDRIIRTVVQSVRGDGRDGVRPVSVPVPGSRLTAINNQQKTRKCCAWAQQQCLLSGESTWDTWRGRPVEPPRCCAPLCCGMLVASRIHRSASFFRHFAVRHPSLRSAHPSLLSL